MNSFPSWKAHASALTAHHKFVQELARLYGWQVVDDPLGILKLGKTFIHGFLSLINFLKARNKHPPIIFNIFPAILLSVTILKPRMVKGMSL